MELYIMKTLQLENFKNINGVKLWLWTLCFTISIGCAGQNEDNPEFGEMNGAGLSASIQSNQFGISIPIWLNGKNSLVPSFNVNVAESIGSEFGIGLRLRTYLNENRIRPYLSPGVAVLFTPPSDSDNEDAKTAVDYVFGFGFGGEYFLSRNFSFGVEASLNVSSSDENSNRFGNPGNININTATQIVANVYF